MPVRKGRGSAPRPIRLAYPSPLPILALGGELKSTISVVSGEDLVTSPHIGDLESLPTFEHFRKTIFEMLDYYGVKPGLVVTDLHPDYESTRFGKEFARERGLHLLSSPAGGRNGDMGTLENRGGFGAPSVRSGRKVGNRNSRCRPDREECFPFASVLKLRQTIRRRRGHARFRTVYRLRGGGSHLARKPRIGDGSAGSAARIRRSGRHRASRLPCQADFGAKSRSEKHGQRRSRGPRPGVPSRACREYRRGSCDAYPTFRTGRGCPFGRGLPEQDPAGSCNRRFGTARTRGGHGRKSACKRRRHIRRAGCCRNPGGSG